MAHGVPPSLPCAGRTPCPALQRAQASRHAPRGLYTSIIQHLADFARAKLYPTRKLEERPNFGKILGQNYKVIFFALLCPLLLLPFKMHTKRAIALHSFGNSPFCRMSQDNLHLYRYDVSDFFISIVLFKPPCHFKKHSISFSVTLALGPMVIDAITSSNFPNSISKCDTSI